MLVKVPAKHQNEVWLHNLDFPNETCNYTANFKIHKDAMRKFLHESNKHVEHIKYFQAVVDTDNCSQNATMLAFSWNKLQSVISYSVH
jgi:hypothetical protein